MHKSYRAIQKPTANRAAPFQRWLSPCGLCATQKQTVTASETRCACIAAMQPAGDGLARSIDRPLRAHGRLLRSYLPQAPRASRLRTNHLEAVGFLMRDSLVDNLSRH